MNDEYKERMMMAQIKLLGKTIKRMGVPTTSVENKRLESLKEKKQQLIKEYMGVKQYD